MDQERNNGEIIMNGDDKITRVEYRKNKERTTESDLLITEKDKKTGEEIHIFRKGTLSVDRTLRYYAPSETNDSIISNETKSNENPSIEKKKEHTNPEVVVQSSINDFTLLPIEQQIEFMKLSHSAIAYQLNKIIENLAKIKVPIDPIGTKKDLGQNLESLLHSLVDLIKFNQKIEKLNNEQSY